MKKEPKGTSTNDQLPSAAISVRIGEETTVQIPQSKFLKDITSEQRKKEANKPIYLIRYE